MQNIDRLQLDTQRCAMDELPEIVIRPSRGWRWLDLRELWAYRELIYFLTWRDIKVRYKQTAIGVAWAVLQPLAMMAVFTLFFGRMAQMPSEGVPYPVFVLAGLVPWQLFARALTESSSSLVTDQRLITKVYFPRLIVPLSTVLAAIVDLLIALGLLLILMPVFGVWPDGRIAALPVFILLLVVTALGVGFWLSALNVEYRDVRYVVPFLTQFWLFVTPVIYPTSQVPEGWRFLYALNPMVSAVEGFRWSLLGVGEGPSAVMAISAGVALLLFLTGIVWFRRLERTFVDTMG
ncbi:MAG TPA: ABC transporter permease [Anaerolineae bacterium]|nr:ABC transporter permease [Anaerolineae bacterium]